MLPNKNKSLKQELWAFQLKAINNSSYGSSCVLQHSSFLYYDILLTQHNSSLPSHDLNHISLFNASLVQVYTNALQTHTELHLHLALAWNTENLERKCRWLMVLSHSSTITVCTERSSGVIRGYSYLLLSHTLFTSRSLSAQISASQSSAHDLYVVLNNMLK